MSSTSKKDTIGYNMICKTGINEQTTLKGLIDQIDHFFSDGFMGLSEDAMESCNISFNMNAKNDPEKEWSITIEKRLKKYD